MKEAIFAGGCFWCTEAVFMNIKGVEKVISGYIGGNVDDPNYEIICSGKSGHYEAIKILYDPLIITYGKLLEIFFATHDPTQINGQGNDIGSQYLSAIFFFDEYQKKEANNYMDIVSKNYIEPIITKLFSVKKFYPAEDYHQNYYNLNQRQPYCAIVINPKMIKFSEEYKHLLKTGS